MKLAILALALAQDPIVEFRAAFDGARDDAGREKAFELLARGRSPQIVAEASQYLTRGSEAVRTAAAGVLATYRDDEPAARALLAAIDRQKLVSIKIAFLRAYGDTDSETAAVWLIPHLRDEDLEVARASAEVAGRVRTGELVMPLMQRMAEMEAALVNVTRPTGASPEERVHAACREALRQTTGQTFDTAAAHAVWWKQNRETFREPDDILPP